jgi:SnoaL-like domain
MPWYPDLFSGPALARIYGGERPATVVPYFRGLMAGEPDALIRSFAGEPELQHPVRGRVKGARAFAAFVGETHAWLEQRNVSVQDIDHVVTDRRGFEEVVLHLDGPNGRVDLPVAVVADRRPDGRIDELRVYHSTCPLTGRPASRRPLLQPDPKVRPPDVIGEYQHALAAGDLDAIVAAFEPDGYAREPAGDRYLHTGPGRVREFHRRWLSNGGGIPLEHCALTDDRHTCALEYNVVRRGQTGLPPEAGLAVYVRGESGKLAAARIYDAGDPPLGSNI